MNLDDLKGQPPSVLDALSAATLLALQNAANERAAEVSRLQSIIHATLAKKYVTGLNKLGVTHIDEGDIRISVTLPKRVKWDQDKLRAACATLVLEWGEAAEEYVETTYSVSERKFDAWPSKIKSLFEPARTVEAGKPKIELSVIGADEEREAA